MTPWRGRARAATLALLASLATQAYPAGARVAPDLAAEARRVARSGGVTGSCYGCASERMKALARRVVEARFAPAGPAAVRTASCIVAAESGWNPGAISRTGDYGLAQINRAAHEEPGGGRPSHRAWWRPRAGFRYRILDPVFNAGVMWSMSGRGRSWGPWTGTWGNGMCR